MDQHVSARTALLLLRCVAKARKFVDQATCNAFVCALVFTHLDYCNPLLVRALLTTLNHLKWVQNAVARLVVGRMLSQIRNSESIRKEVASLASHPGTK